MPRVNINKLLVFYAVVDEIERDPENGAWGAQRRAASTLGCTPPTVCEHLQDLNRKYGPLIDTTTGVWTDRGKALYSLLRDVFHASRRVEAFLIGVKKMDEDQLGIPGVS